ncbi:ABC transporter permease [Chloroflexota bacterium]
MSEIDIITETTEAPSVADSFQRFRRVFLGRPLVVFGVFIAVLFIITAIFGPLFAPYSPDEQNLDNILKQPSAEHWLGTDALGRDVLTRIIYGGRISMMVGIVAVGMAAISGQTLGLVAAFFGGPTEVIIMRFIDALMSLPLIMKALVIAALLGGGLWNVMIAIGVGMLGSNARLMYGMALSVKESDYITAAHLMGARNVRIMLRHIFPNSFPPLIVLITMEIGRAILAEAGLSFLGIGIQLPTATWGGMVSDGYHYLLSLPLLSFAPGLAIMLVVFSINMIGDGLRDALDPKLRGTL